MSIVPFPSIINHWGKYKQFSNRVNDTRYKENMAIFDHHSKYFTVVAVAVCAVKAGILYCQALVPAGLRLALFPLNPPTHPISHHQESNLNTIKTAYVISVTPRTIMEYGSQTHIQASQSVS